MVSWWTLGRKPDCQVGRDKVATVLCRSILLVQHCLHQYLRQLTRVNAFDSNVVCDTDSVETAPGTPTTSTQKSLCDTRMTPRTLGAPARAWQ